MYLKFGKFMQLVFYKASKNFCGISQLLMERSGNHFDMR